MTCFTVGTHSLLVVKAIHVVICQLSMLFMVLSFPNVWPGGGGYMLWQALCLTVLNLAPKGLGKWSDCGLAVAAAHLGSGGGEGGPGAGGHGGPAAPCPGPGAGQAQRHGRCRPAEEGNPLLQHQHTVSEADAGHCAVHAGVESVPDKLLDIVYTGVAHVASTVTWPAFQYNNSVAQIGVGTHAGAAVLVCHVEPRSTRHTGTATSQLCCG